MNTIFDKSLPSSLVKKLGEAADGFRNSGEVFFISSYEFPHPTKDFPDLASAQAYFSDNGFSENDYGIFGPFTTEDDICGLNFLGVEDIDKVHLTIHYKDGRQQKETFTGDIDSIFFNISSFDKFVFPYYCQVFGAEYAKKIRKKLIDQYEAAAKSQSQSVVKLVPPPPSVHSRVTYVSGLTEELGSS